MSEHDAVVCVKPCVECLRIWLDRKRPLGSWVPGEATRPNWRDWFDGERYLGNRSGPLPTEGNGVHS